MARITPKSNSVVDSNNTQTQNGPSVNNTNNTAQKSNRKTILYIVIALIVVIALVILLTSFNSSGPTVTTIGTKAGTPIYLSYFQGESLIGNIASYSTSDLFNSTNPINITFIESITPYAAGNVTEGWSSILQNNNATKNATLEFFVMKAHNTSKLSRNITDEISQFFASPPQSSSNTYNGMNYTYDSYSNSTINIQLVVGWKGNYTTLSILSSNPSFKINENTLVGLTANDTP